MGDSCKGKLHEKNSCTASSPENNALTFQTFSQEKENYARDFVEKKSCMVKVGQNIPHYIHSLASTRSY